MVEETKKFHNQERQDDISSANKADEIITEIEYKKKHKELIKHWEFPSGFPSEDVVEGYTSPYIDEMNDINLTWGKPNFKALKELALNQLKWHPYEIKNCIEETEKKRENGWNFSAQKKIGDYFNKQHKFAEYKSKRIISAVGKIRRKQNKKVKSN